MSFYALDFAVIVIALVVVRSWTAWKKRRAGGSPLPPGPRRLPIIGNVLDMPGKDEWETARQWGEKYGDLIYIENFGTRYLFVNSYEAAVELFEKRGNIYSSRPSTTMVDLEGWSWFTSAMPYGDELKKSRQFLNMFFQKPVSKNYYGVQTQSTFSLLLKLLQSPDDFHAHIQHTAAETIIKVAYGYQIIEDDPYVALAGRGVEAFTNALTFYLVNALPALRHLPSWFPGTTFHQIAEEGHKLSTAMYHDPFDKAKAMIADGTAEPSMTSKLLESQADENGDVQHEDIIAKAVGIAYAGGGDTVSHNIPDFSPIVHVFDAAMVLYPDAMRKGQDELDRVIGKGNLPTFDDRSKLPYIDAIYYECLRWQTVAPLAVAHLVEKDDIYNGYFIPAGTAVYPNSWAILRDPKRYLEPEKFIPDRWLPSPGKERPLDPNKVAFGFGRRICPGRFFAENSVFIGIASILAAFNIEKALDENGVPITPVEDYTSNIVRHPKPFKCKITPRSEEAVAAIYQATSFAK